MQVLVTGEVQVSPYIDKAGKPAASMELTANDVKLLTSKEEMDRRANGEYDEADTETEPQPTKTAARAKRPVEDEQDIPF